MSQRSPTDMFGYGSVCMVRSQYGKVPPAAGHLSPASPPFSHAHAHTCRPPATDKHGPKAELTSGRGVSQEPSSLMQLLDTAPIFDAFDPLPSLTMDGGNNNSVMASDTAVFTSMAAYTPPSSIPTSTLQGDGGKPVR